MCYLKNYVYITDKRSHFKNSGHSDYFWSACLELGNSVGFILWSPGCTIFSVNKGNSLSVTSKYVLSFGIYLDIWRLTMPFFMACVHLYHHGLSPRTQKTEEHFLKTVLSVGLRVTMLVPEEQPWNVVLLPRPSVCWTCRGATGPPLGGTWMTLLSLGPAGLPEDTVLNNWPMTMNRSIIPTVAYQPASAHFGLLSTKDTNEANDSA